MEIFIPFISLVSAVVGALLNSYFSGKRQDQQNLLASRRLQEQITVSSEQQQRQNKINMTLKLYEQYEAPEMAKSRVKVISSFKKYSEQEPPLSYEQIKSMNPDGSYDDIHILLHFFERASILYKEGYLDERLFRATLAGPFYLYYSNYISRFISIARERGELQRHWMLPIEELADTVKSFEEVRISG